MVLWTAFLVGFLGSLHCVGMCAPIAMALPATGPGRKRFVISRLLYNGGRIVTYVLLGVLLGLLGEGFSLAGLQQYLSIGAGIVLLFAVILPFFSLEKGPWTKPVYGLNAFLKQKFASLFKKKTLAASFWTGFFNGLLPCGLVYVALAGALAQADILRSMAYMGIFGAGTLPLMLSASLAGQLISPALKIKFRKAIPALMMVLAIVFILRGLNLGIPYLSPQINYSNTFDITSCQ